MKNAKINFVAIMLISLVAMIGCREVNLVEPIEGVPSGLIVMKVSGGEGVTVIGDTTYVEQGVVANLYAESNGPTITSWTWTIYGFAYNGQAVKYKFEGAIGSTTVIRLAGREANGTEHVATRPFKVVSSLDGMRDVQWWVSNIGGNNYSAAIALNKTSVNYVGGSSFFYKLRLVDQAWGDRIPVPTVDHNWNISNNTLVTPPSGVGLYFVIRPNLTPGDYELIAGKLDSFGNEQWLTINGSNGVQKFNLNTTGIIVWGPGSNPSGLPGIVGDEGSGAVIRWDDLADRLVLLINNQADFNTISPFVILYDSAGTATTRAQIAVPNFPKWGAVELMNSSLPSSGLVSWDFGPNISNTGVLGSNRQESIYYHTPSGRMRAIITGLQLGKKLAGGENLSVQPAN